MGFVKICGITNCDDARELLAYGVDAVGLNFFSGSARCVSLEGASKLLALLSSAPSMWKVGVFVDHCFDSLLELLEILALDTLQFHGGESAELCREFQKRGYRIIKALRLKGGDEDLFRLDSYRNSVDFFLLDAYHPSLHGGTGLRIEEGLVERLYSAGLAPSSVILSGGLGPSNVSAEIERLGPFGVDVASGVESSPGIKDRDKLRAFVEAARASFLD